MKRLFRNVEIVVIFVVVKKKTIKRPWSEVEKSIVLEYFQQSILRNDVPGKREIEKCMKLHPVLQSRTWRNIKDCVRNRVTSRKGKKRFVFC